jgi:hypothetical protein
LISPNVQTINHFENQNRNNLPSIPFLVFKRELLKIIIYKCTKRIKTKNLKSE